MTAVATVGKRLMAGPEGYEPLADHLRRLGPLPADGRGAIDALKQSGLRGRGGAAFPTWKKWDAVARSSTGNAVVVVNGSEGEPLSIKDRTLLNQRPHAVLDGAAIAAQAIGATDVILYLSRGKDDAEHAVRNALDERRRAGLREPVPSIVRTSHRYIAGESSAVVNRVSGGSSKPRFSLKRTAEKGVDDRPTLVQNAETMAHVAMIARYGADWFRGLGTEQSPGSALMTLCGNVLRPGVYEVNLAGSAGGAIAAAGGPQSAPAGALVGGYFGTWVAAGALATLPLDRALGCGVLAVLPQNGCGIVEASRILTYLAWESSGQCGPCVNGLGALADAMERIAASKADYGDHERVVRWIDMVRGRGACHHPDGAVGQLAGALSAFKEHLHQHLDGRRCAGLDARGFPRPPSVGTGWK